MRCAHRHLHSCRAFPASILELPALISLAFCLPLTKHAEPRCSRTCRQMWLQRCEKGACMSYQPLSWCLVTLWRSQVGCTSPVPRPCIFKLY